MHGTLMARRQASEPPTAGDRAEPLSEGCLPVDHAADVLAIMRKLDRELIPVRRSSGGGEILGFVHRIALENVQQAGSNHTTVDEAWWLDPPRVREDVPLARILEAHDRAHVYLVVDAGGRPVGMLRPDTLESIDGPSKPT